MFDIKNKTEKALPILNIVIIFYILLFDLTLKFTTFPGTQHFILYSLALVTVAFLTPFSWKKKLTWSTNIFKLVVWIALVIASLYNTTGAIYFLYFIQVIYVSLRNQNLTQVLLWAFFLTITYLVTFIYNDNLKEQVISWGFFGVLINMGSAYIWFNFYKSSDRLTEINKILTGILTNTSNGIQYIDTEGKTRILNPAAEEIYGKTQEETYGKVDWELFYNGKKYDQNGKYTSLITETLETGKIYKDIEKKVITPKGEEKVYKVETFRLFDDEGKLMGAMGVYVDITEQQEMQRQLLDAHYEMATMAVTDELTKVYNVRYFRQRLNEEVAKAYNSTLSLLMIDADYFKIYNDLYGHQAGDKVLQRLALLIKENVRETDIVARYGGEEFTVILPGMKKEKAREVAERIRQAVKEFNFLGQEKLPKGRLTVTIGVASIPDDAKTSEELIRIADNALYRGKYASRDMVVADK